jgi:hypothetical protein
MALKYKPVKTQTDDRNWRTTLAIDAIVKVLDQVLPGFEVNFQKIFSEEEKTIQLHNNKIQLTHYQEGVETLIYEEKNNIQQETAPAEPVQVS